MTDTKHVRFGLAVPDMNAIYAHLAALSSLGFDRDEGLRLEYRYFDVPNRAADALAAGDCDVAPLNTTVGIVGRGRGLPMVAVYGMAHRTHRWFAVLPHSPVTTLADLAGRRVSCDVANLRSLAESALVADGVDPRDVTFVPWRGSDMEAAQMLPALEGGEVDAVFIIDWNHGNLVAEGVTLRRLPSRMLDAISLSSCIWTTSGYLARNPDTVSGLGRAFARATMYALNAPRDTVERMAAMFPGSLAGRDRDAAIQHALAVLEARLEPMRPRGGTHWRWGALNGEEMAWWIRQLDDSGALAGTVSPSECFTDRYVEVFNDFDPAAVLQRIPASQR